MKLETGNRAEKSGTERGFTLLELLVAMTILVVIVLATTQIFNQSSMAWDSGTKKAEVNMTGRAVADFMAQELSQAVCDGAIINQPFPQPSAGQPVALPLIFATLGGDPTSRVVRIVEYSWSGSPDNRLYRRSQIWDPSNPATKPYTNLCWNGISMMWESGQPLSQNLPPIEMASDVSALVITPYYGQNPQPNDLPLYVDVNAAVQRAEDIAKNYPAVSFESRAYLVNRNRYRY